MVSVIVPIYNVEEYLPRCIDSLRNIKGDNVEIILVDDGSTDRCGKIIDEIHDRSFRIFHTENHGLSAARNYGIDHSRGEWLMFVDSDDWVEPEFCRIPLQKAGDYGADLVIFGFRSWKKGKEIHPSAWKKMKNSIKNAMGVAAPQCPIGIVSAEEAIRFGGSVAWNRLYRKELFIDIRYPEGRVYEDVATTHKLIYAAKNTALIPDVLYNHVYREDSISNTASEMNRRAGFISAKERYDFLKEHDCAVEINEPALWYYAMMYLMRTTESDEIVMQAEDVLDSIPGIPDVLPLKKRIMLLAWKIDKRLFHAICRFFGKKSR